MPYYLLYIHSKEITMHSRNRSQEEVEKILWEYHRSKQSRQEFCRRKNIKLGTFQWWLKRYKAAKIKGSQNEAFIRLTPQQKHSHSKDTSESELIIDFQSGTRIRWRGTEIPSSVYGLIADLNKGSVI